MIKPIKIAHYPASFLPVIGGAELIVHNLAEAQTDEGHDVYVFGNTKTKKYFRKLKIKPNYSLIVIPSYIYVLKKFFSLESTIFSSIISFLTKRYQKKYEFDLWHMNLISEYSVAVLKCLNILNIPCIGTFRGSDIQMLPDVNYGRRLNPSFNKMIINNVKNFSHLTAISNSVYDEYLKLDYPEKNIQIIPNFISKNNFNIKEFDREKILARYELQTNKKIILTVGRNHPKKGYKNIPLIIKELIKKEKDFTWLIVGKDCEEIMDISKNKNIDSYLKIINQITNDDNNKRALIFPPESLIQLYKLADIFCFPTLIETFGNIFLEAMASECPIVTTNAPGARDIIKHDYNGLVTDINNIHEFSKYISLLINDRKLCRKIINGGLETISQFDRSMVTKKYIDLYKIVLKENMK